MRIAIILILAYTQAPEVLEPSCAICLERLPNVRYTHPTSTHLAICSDCDATQEFTECPVCKQVIDTKETLNEKEKRNLKKKLLRAKKTEESVRNALILREEQEKAEIKARKQRVSFLVMEAYVFIEHNGFESAEQHLYKALELDPKSDELWFDLGRVQLGLNRVDEALTMFDYTLELNCSDAHLVRIAFALWTQTACYENGMKDVINYVSRVKNEKDLEPSIGTMYHLLMGLIDLCQNSKHGAAKKHYNVAIYLAKDIQTDFLRNNLLSRAHMGLKEIYAYYGEKEEVEKQDRFLSELKEKM